MSDAFSFSAPKRPVSKVFIHCSASDNPAHDDISVIRQWHMRDNGWSDVGYHYFVKKNGEVQAGRSLEVRPATQFPFNAGTLAICVSGLKADSFTKEQFASLRAVCGAMHAQIPAATFHGHCEVNKHKTCPVFNYRAVLGLDAKGNMR